MRTKATASLLPLAAQGQCMLSWWTAGKMEVGAWGEVHAVERHPRKECISTLYQ